MFNKKSMFMKSLLLLPLVVIALVFNIIFSPGKTFEKEIVKPEVSVEFSDGDIQAAIRALENDKSMVGTHWGFCAYNLNKKQYVAQKNCDLRLVPASVLKVFTTISAYEIYGHEATFETHLYYDGTISGEGVLDGDLVIYGTGDPSIACDYFGNSFSALTVFSSFKNALVKAGIRKINGNIIGDASLWGYMLQAPGYLWEDLGNYYGAGSSSLNYNENKLRVSFKPGRAVGDSADLLSITPHPIEPVWINNVTTAASNTGDNVYIYGTPFQKVRLLTGTVPAGKTDFTVWASDPDPALRLVSDFQDYLSKSGIQVSGKSSSEYVSTRYDKGSMKLIHTHHSPSIKEISRYVNHKSHNVSAESLFRYCGMKLNNSSSYEETAKALLDYWMKKGIKTGQIVVKDGSGLSRTNMITTDFLVDMLVYTYQQVWFQDFYDILPVAGKDGTLRTNFKGTSVENNMRGKSGFLQGVRSYTGYVHNRSGELIAFAVIVNGHMLKNNAIRMKLEKLIISLSDSL
jgi:serine-type D-Ala-D-Ala carboxypeptidase/endopeptidase (penicillin-binding protein 4)